MAWVQGQEVVSANTIEAATAIYRTKVRYPLRLRMLNLIQEPKHWRAVTMVTRLITLPGTLAGHIAHCEYATSHCPDAPQGAGARSHGKAR